MAIAIPATEHSYRRWIRAVVVATALASIATCVAFLFLYLTIYQGMWNFIGTGAKISRVLQGVTSVAWLIRNAIWAALFAAAYRAFTFIQRATRDSLAFIPVAICLALLMSRGDDIQRTWLYHSSVRVVTMPVLGSFARALMTYPQGLWGWMAYALFIAPALVWGISRYAPTQATVAGTVIPEPTAPVASSASPNWNGAKIAIGVALIPLSAMMVGWLQTSPEAGYLMVLGALMWVFGYVVIVASLSLVISGIWGMMSWPRRQLAQLVPVLLALAVFFYSMLRTSYRL
jgi:hypothetical protein